MKMGRNPGNNAVAPDQANVSAPMADEQMSAGGMSTDFTFTIAPMTALSNSDAQDMMKSSDAYLCADGLTGGAWNAAPSASVNLASGLRCGT